MSFPQHHKLRQILLQLSFCEICQKFVEEINFFIVPKDIVRSVNTNFNFQKGISKQIFKSNLNIKPLANIMTYITNTEYCVIKVFQ